jgi:hypothetical protein
MDMGFSVTKEAGARAFLVPENNKGCLNAV